MSFFQLSDCYEDRCWILLPILPAFFLLLASPVVLISKQRNRIITWSTVNISRIGLCASLMLLNMLQVSWNLKREEDCLQLLQKVGSPSCAAAGYLLAIVLLLRLKSKGITRPHMISLFVLLSLVSEITRVTLSLIFEEREFRDLISSIKICTLSLLLVYCLIPDKVEEPIDADGSFIVKNCIV